MDVYGVDVIVGPVCCQAAAVASMLAHRRGVPVISWGCSAEYLSDKVCAMIYTVLYCRRLQRLLLSVGLLWCMVQGDEGGGLGIIFGGGGGLLVIDMDYRSRAADNVSISLFYIFKDSASSGVTICHLFRPFV